MTEPDQQIVCGGVATWQELPAKVNGGDGPRSTARTGLKTYTRQIYWGLRRRVKKALKKLLFPARRRLHDNREILKAAVGDTRPIVFAFVNNPGVNDSRVLKEAKSLNSAGYRVILFATIHKEWPNHHMFEGIEIRRFEMFADPGKVDPVVMERLVDIMGHDTVDEILIRLAEVRNGAWRDDEDRVAKRTVAVFSAAVAMARLKFKETPVLIHAHDLYPLAGAALLAERTGAKVIFDAHEIETERMPPMPLGLKAFIDRQERKLLTRTDGIVVCCESSADFYAERFPGPRPSVVMNAPSEDLSVTGQSFDLRAACNVVPEAPLVIYTGGVGRAGRGLHLALQALAMLPKFHLVILGPRQLHNDAWLMGVADATNTADRVHLLPPVRPDEVVDAIRGADVGICLIQDVTLSYRFAMPNKLFEMSFAGVPLVVSDLPEMGQFVVENEIGVTVDQTSPTAIAAALEEVYQNRDRYAPDTQRLNSMLKKYSWSVQAAELNLLYSSLLGDVNVQSDTRAA